MKKQPLETLPIYDIHQVTFASMNDIPVDYAINGSRVAFLLPADTKTYQILTEYNQNPKVNLLDFVSALRRVRAQMLSVRDSHEKGKREGVRYEYNYNK